MPTIGQGNLETVMIDLFGAVTSTTTSRQPGERLHAHVIACPPKPPSEGEAFKR